MKFDCEQCGKIDEAFLNGYAVGDRLLEGVMFIVRKNDDGKCRVRLHPDAEPYMQGLNKEMWLERAKIYAEQTDIFECPKCAADVVPDDMLVPADGGTAKNVAIAQPVTVAQVVKVFKKRPKFLE
jgi:hypothetical protein